MALPSIISQEERQILNAIYNQYDSYKEWRLITESDFQPLFCLSFSNSVVIFKCGRSNLKDAFSRPIHALEGLVVPRDDKEQFLRTLPYLVSNYMNVLNIVQRLEPSKLDFMSQEVLQETVSIETLRASCDERLSSIKMKTHAALTSKVERISFDQDGFNQLLSYLLFLPMSLIDFAFGALGNILNIVPSIRIIAPLPDATRGGFKGHKSGSIENSAVADEQTKNVHGPLDSATEKSIGMKVDPERPGPRDLISSEQGKVPSEMSRSGQDISSSQGKDNAGIIFFKSEVERYFGFFERRIGWFELHNANDFVVDRSETFVLPFELKALNQNEKSHKAYVVLKRFTEQLEMNGWRLKEEKRHYWWRIRFERIS
jgi:hypothetical protein